MMDGGRAADTKRKRLSTATLSEDGPVVGLAAKYCGACASFTERSSSFAFDGPRGWVEEDIEGGAWRSLQDKVHIVAFAMSATNRQRSASGLQVGVACVGWIKAQVPSRVPQDLEFMSAPLHHSSPSKTGGWLRLRNIYEHDGSVLYFPITKISNHMVKLCQI